MDQKPPASGPKAPLAVHTHVVVVNNIEHCAYPMLLPPVIQRVCAPTKAEASCGLLKAALGSIAHVTAGLVLHAERKERERNALALKQANARKRGRAVSKGTGKGAC